ncbi:MAG TPA: VWA domain-containing protein [Clostridium sp.]|nr:VWA domain-containing protein [Clostridium sp.]
MIKRLLYKESTLLLIVCFLMQIISATVIGGDVYASSEGIRVEFYNGDVGDSVGALCTNFKVINTGSSTVALSDIKLRYYFTDDGVSPISVFIDYAENSGSGINSCITYTIKDTNSSDANKYIEFGFNTAAGSLAPDTYALVRARVYQSGYNQVFTQTNDYSFCKKNINFAEWDKVTGYLNGVLFSGKEPVELISTPSPVTPTPQMSPIPTITPSPSTTPEVTPTPSDLVTPTNWMDQAVPNGDFEDGMAFWSFYFDNVSGANANNLVHTEPSGNKRSKTAIKNVGSNNWTIQLKHTGVELKNSKTYRLTFDAKSTIPRDIRVSVQDATNSLIEYSGSVVGIDSHMKTYTCEFAISSSKDITAAIVFEMGKVGTTANQPHDIILDNVDIKEIAAPLTPPSPGGTDDPLGVGITASRNSIIEAELGEEGDILLSQGGEISVAGTIDTEKEVVLILDNSGALNSYVHDILSPLDFGIYSNRDLTIQGNNATINGSVHTNNLFTSTAETIKISQTCSAASFDITSKKVDIKTFKNITIPIEMPYFHTELLADALKNSMVFNPEDYPPSWFPYPMPGQKDVFITYNLFANRFEIFGMGKLVINSSMYFNGDVLISLTETNNVNDGFIVAKGNIIIQGENLKPKGPKDKLYVYSINGNIECQTKDSTINGIAYAPGAPGNPNSGKIIFTGDNNTINGAIAGNELKFNGNGLKVNHTEGQFNTIEEKYMENSSRLKMVKDAAKSFVDKFAGSQTKVSIIKYSDSANDNHFTQYDLSLSDNATILKDKIDKIVPGTTGFSNMGDAMRRAYHILNNSTESSSAKYIVVLTGSAPNRWTGISDITSEPKTENGKADYIKADDVSYSSSDYAKDIGKLITSSGINLMFIDFSEESIGTVLEDIAAVSGAKVVEATGKHYYRADNFMELIDIFDSIRLKIYYDVILNNVLYQEILPAGVLLVEVPDGMSTQSVLIDGITRTKITGVINNIPLTYTGTGYSFNIDNFKIKVKFLKPGTIIFDGADSKIRYNIDYIDSGGNSQSKSIDKHFDDMTVNVTMTVDIN